MNIVCIDPGHGGDDAGMAAAPGGAPEKDLMLALAKHLGNACREHGWQVSLTRIDDRDLPTQQRSFRANRTGAACFLSLHACTEVSRLLDPAGTTLPSAARVIYQGGHGRGHALATAVHAALTVECGLPDGGIVAAPRLDLLRWCSIPAVLLELPEGEGLLAAAEGQARIATAVAAALAGVFGA
jgi:N-acetylmuramoyl-L-alanine amidase